MTNFPPGVDWAAIAANFPRVIADLLSDHNLANHPLAIIPTMDDAHIPVGIARVIDVANLMAAHILVTDAHHAVHLKTLADHPLNIIPTMDDAHIPNLDVAKITTGRFGMARMPAGTATYILTAQGAGSDPAYAAPPAADVGGLYGINVESLGADKELVVDTDEIYQYLSPSGANRNITLSTVGASAGDRFVIRNNATYATQYCLDIKQGANRIELVYTNDIVEFIFDGTNWIAAGVGTGQYYGDRNRNIGIGYKANANREGVAIGYDAQGYLDGVAIGGASRGYTYGVAVGYGARGYSYGTAVGKSAYAYNYGTALGLNAQTGNQQLSIALGYYSKNTRTAETVTQIDFSTTAKNQVVQGRWFGDTDDDTPTIISLGDRGARFTLQYASALSFSGLIVATTQATPGTPNVTKGWKVEGIIKRDADNNSTMVAVTHTVLGNDGGAAAWTAVVDADDAWEALRITVTGAIGTTIRWAAYIDGVEIKW